jgi:RNA polymerase sigma-70 factor (sigma-E family)
MRAEWEREYADYAAAGLARLQRMAYVLCGDRHRAGDLVQNTLVKLYLKWPRARAVEHLDAYVRKMLLHQFLMERRQPWARIRLTATVPDPPPDTATSGTEDRPALVAALRRVAPRQRAVLVLRFLYDLPVDEVATLLGCSPGTVKSQSARGLATMRKLLGQPLAAVPSSPRSSDGHR